MKNNKKILIIIGIVVVLAIGVLITLMLLRNNEIADNELAVIKEETEVIGEDKFLNGPIMRKEIETIEFLDHKDISEKAIGSWDISKAGVENIIAWYEESENTTEANEPLYNVYIGSTSKISANENSAYLFAALQNLRTIEFNGNFDTSRATNMEGMFHYTGIYSKELNLNLSDFNTAKVENMSAMFSNFGLVTEELKLDLSSFDTSKVTNMSYMFAQTGKESKNFDLNVSTFNTAEVTTMEYMFIQTGHADPEFNLDVTNFNTEKVTTMWSMFFETGFNSTTFNLDLSSFKTANNMYYRDMFYGTGQKNPGYILDLRNMEFNNKIDSNEIFATINPNVTIYLKTAEQAQILKDTTDIPATAKLVDCSLESCEK